MFTAAVEVIVLSTAVELIIMPATTVIAVVIQVLLESL